MHESNVQQFLDISGTILAIVVFVLSYGKYKWWLYAVHGFDMLSGFLEAILFIKVGVFLAQLISIVLSTFVLNYRQTDYQLRQAIRMYRSKKIRLRRFRFEIAWFLRAHHSQTVLIQKVDKMFLSKLFLLSSIPNLLANVNLLAAVFFSKKDLGTRSLVGLLCFGQSLMAISILVCIAEGSHSLHLPSHKLATIQTLLRSENIHQKWKMLKYFELIHSKHKTAFTLGFLGNITYATIFEVCKFIPAFVKQHSFT